MKPPCARFSDRCASARQLFHKQLRRKHPAELRGSTIGISRRRHLRPPLSNAITSSRYILWSLLGGAGRLPIILHADYRTCADDVPSGRIAQAASGGTFRGTSSPTRALNGAGASTLSASPAVSTTID